MAHVLRLLFFAACLAPLSDAAGAQTSGKMVRSRSKGAEANAINPDELKEKLSQVMISDQVQQMMKDPQLKDGLKDLLHNPEEVGKLMNDPSLATSLQFMLEKDPHFVDALIPGDVPAQHMQALVDLEGATVEEIHAEFSRLQKADQEHARHLHDSINVRKNLKRELDALSLSVADDNKLVDTHVNKASSLMSVSAQGKMQAEPLTDDFEELPEDTNPASRQDIGSGLVEYAAKIRDLIKQLHAKDAVQMTAMRNNAKTRRKLKVMLQKRIKEQQAELDLAVKEEQGAFSELRISDE